MSADSSSKPKPDAEDDTSEADGERPPRFDETAQHDPDSARGPDAEGGTDADGVAETVESVKETIVDTIKGLLETDSMGHERERRRPEETDPAQAGPLGTRNHTQDLLNFEFVLESEDEFLPRTVDSGGVIVTSDGDYVGLARISPRNWSIHTTQKKHEILQTYQSAFLSTLDFYTQIVCYPTKFDISEHIEKLEERVEEMGDSEDEHALVEKGRQIYPVWLTDFLEQNDMKQREYYVVVRVQPEQLRQFEDDKTIGDLLTERAEALEPLVAVVSKLFGEDDSEDEEVTNREQCIREVNNRLSRIEGALQRLDVGVDRIRDRDEALSVLYHYYNNFQPRRDSFDVDTRTSYDPNVSPDADDTQGDAMTETDYDAVATGGEME